MTENKEHDTITLNLPMFSKFGMIGGILLGIAILAFAIGEIVYDVWYISNEISANSSNWAGLAALVILLLAAVFLFFIGGLAIIWSRKGKLPTNIYLPTVLVFIFFVLLGISSITIQYGSGYPFFNVSPGVELIVGAVLLLVSGLIYGGKNLVAKLTGIVIGIAGFILVFIGYTFNPSTALTSLPFLSNADQYFILFSAYPVYLFSYFGFFGSSNIFALVAFIIGAAALIIVLFTKKFKVLIGETMGAISLIIFSIGLIITGAYVISNSVFTDFGIINDFGGISYGYLVQVSQALLLTGGVIFLVSGIFLIIYGLVTIASHATEFGKALNP